VSESVHTVRTLKVAFSDGTSWEAPATEIHSDHKRRYLSYRNNNSGDRVTVNLDKLHWFRIGDPT
jgi:transcriptional antiterminator Rof (Rho-off)